MARGTQHRKRRPAQNARPAAQAVAPRKQKPPQWQEELFFQRLRNHAKPFYVALAVAFVLGFVLLGVGSGSNGLTQAFQSAFNFGSGGGTSISSLKKKVAKHPESAADWRALATAYEAKHETQNAITALQRYTSLAPKDSSGLSELASEYSSQASVEATNYQNAQVAAETASPEVAFALPATSTFGKIFSDPKGLQDPIAQVISTAAETKGQAAYSAYANDERQAEDAFQKVGKLTPTDPDVQYELGQAATSAGDFKTAVAAYERFLKLSPGDVDAAQVRSLLKQVKAEAKASAASSSSTSSSTTPAG